MMGDLNETKQSVLSGRCETTNLSVAEVDALREAKTRFTLFDEIRAQATELCTNLTAFFTESPSTRFECDPALDELAPKMASLQKMYSEHAIKMTQNQGSYSREAIESTQQRALDVDNAIDDAFKTLYTLCAAYSELSGVLDTTSSIPLQLVENLKKTYAAFPVVIDFVEKHIQPRVQSKGWFGLYGGSAYEGHAPHRGYSHPYATRRHADIHTRRLQQLDYFYE